MTDADIRQAIRIVVADRNVAGGVNHVIVDAVVPLQFQRRIEISIRRERVFQEALARGYNRPRGSRQCAGDVRGVSAVDAGQGRRQLAAEHRRCEGVGRRDQHEIGLAAQSQI